MRKFIRQYISVIIFISLPGMISAQENKETKNIVEWHSFADAYKLNKVKPKKMLVDVYTDWCGWCKKMDKETFQNPEIAKYMQKHFYCVKLNAETKDTIVIDTVKFVNSNPTGRGGNNRLAVELLRGKMSYPSYVFINEQNQLLTTVPGYLTADDFSPVLHFFGEEAYKNTKWEDYRDAWIKANKKTVNATQVK